MNFLDKGWECPKCGAVMSPTTSRCMNCRGYDTFTLNRTVPKVGTEMHGEVRRYESKNRQK